MGAPSFATNDRRARQNMSMDQDDDVILLVTKRSTYRE